MGARGPKPIPSALKHLAGTYRADRAPVNEPQPIGKPVCPAWLEGEARAEFRRLVRLLADMGLVGKIDGNALARYARLWVRWRRAEEMIEKVGTVYPIKDGQGAVRCLMATPCVAEARALADQLLKIEQSFGMNPSARSRISVAPPTSDGDELDAFLGDTAPLKFAGGA